VLVARRTTQPAEEPITLAEAKLHLRVDHADEDAYITGLITAARIMCEQRTGRTLITSGWTVRADDFTDVLELPDPPLASVTSVSYVDVYGDTQTIGSTDYRVDTHSEPCRVVPVTEWPIADDRINSVTVVYVAGYGNAAAVPQPLKQWIKLAVGDMYENRTASDRPMGTAAPTASVPHSFVDGLLAAYRVDFL